MKLLFASSEIAPFAKTGGLADVSKSLPAVLARYGLGVKTITPFYRCTKALALDYNVLDLGGFKFLSCKKNKIEHIFLSNDSYYDRGELYGIKGKDYPDNDRRFGYFCRAIVAYATESGFGPDIIHCNDWQTGLVSLFLKLEKGKSIPTLFTIHNLGYQGIFPRESLEKLRIPYEYYHINGIEYYRKISFLKAGIVYSDAINTVSKKYSEEILTPQFGCGMDGILRTRKDDLYGILNGVDYSDWDPRIDKFIACRYDSNTIEKKTVCKNDLIKEVGFSKKTMERPIIGIISRLAEQKGIDLVVNAAERLIDVGVNVILLGTGDEKYNHICREMGKQYPEYIATYITFDNVLAHKIEAGCDFFLMPSRYEPCGLNQLYSMRYGTVPIVSATGGLDDTVLDLYENPINGNGIKFKEANVDSLIEAVSRAVSLYKNKAEWHIILNRIMQLDFSWEKSASEYKQLYVEILQKKRWKRQVN